MISHNYLIALFDVMWEPDGDVAGSVRHCLEVDLAVAYGPFQHLEKEKLITILHSSNTEVN